MKRNFIFSSIAMSVLLLGTGCGGSDSNDNQKVGYYVDSAVSGVTYSCTSANRTYNGTTDSVGTFYYEDGQECTFSVGGVELRRANVSEISNSFLFENNIRTAQFLQTLDNNANPSDGIEITASVVTALANQRVDHVPSNDSELANIVSNLRNNVSTYHGELIEASVANSHLRSTRTGLTAGGWHVP